MFWCGACGLQHQSSDEARACYGLKSKSKPKTARAAQSSRGAQVPPRTGRSSKSGQLRKRDSKWSSGIPPFDVENREPYN